MTTAAHESFNAIALPFLDDVYRFALSLTRDEADADDLTQDTFLKAFRSWASFQVGTNCRAWLFTICRNSFNRRFRRERSRVDVEQEGGDDDSLPTVLGHVHIERMGLGDLLDRIDVQPALREALDGLPDVFREIVTLVDLEEFSYAEAAEVLEVPVGTVRSRLFRARRRMQSALLDQAVDMGLVTSDPEDCDPVNDPPQMAPECEGVVRALWDLVDGEIAPEDVSQLRQHLDACSYCRAHEDFERRLVREIGRLRCEPADPIALASQVRSRLTEAFPES